MIERSYKMKSHLHSLNKEHNGHYDGGEHNIMLTYSYISKT